MIIQGDLGSREGSSTKRRQMPRMVESRWGDLCSESVGGWAASIACMKTSPCIICDGRSCGVEVLAHAGGSIRMPAFFVEQHHRLSIGRAKPLLAKYHEELLSSIFDQKQESGPVSEIMLYALNSDGEAERVGKSVMPPNPRDVVGRVWKSARIPLNQGRFSVCISGIAHIRGLV